MKINDLLNDEFLNALERLINQPIDSLTAKIIAQNYSLIHSAINEYESLRISVLYDYAQKDNNMVITSENNIPEINEDNIEQIASILEPFLNKKLDLLPIDIAKIQSITPKDILLLKDLIK